MSFLPYAAPDGRTWFGALGLSTAAHGGLAFLVLFSGAVVLLPDPQSIQLRTPEFAVTLDILDADVIDETDPPVDDRIPEDAVALTPDDLAAETPEDTLAALAPEDEVLTPALPDEAALPDDTVLAPQPETALPEAIEPDPVPTASVEALAPEPTAPEITDPYAADLAPEPTTPEPVPLAPEPTPVDDGLAIDSLSPIDDTVLNPLAEGSGPAITPEVAPVEEEDLAALSLPEPEVLAPIISEPAPEEDEIAPVALAPAEITEPTEELTAPTDVDEPEAVETLPDPEAPEPAPIDPEPEAVTPEDTTPEPADLVAEPVTPQPGETDVPDEAAVAAAPAPTALPNPTAADLAIGQMIRRIRAAPNVQCVLALPRRAGGAAGAGLSLIGADPARMDDVAGQITSGLDPAPVQTRETIDNRQCAALDALRQSASYPASRIGLGLDSGAILRSGDSLTGRVVGAGGLYVTLLIIDDNGVVQDLAPFVSLDDTTLVFDAPVARSGPARATRQLLVAIGTTDAPLDLSDRIGRTAQEVFGPIPAEVLESAVFGVASFDVR